MLSTDTLIETTVKMRVRKVIIAASRTIFDLCLADGVTEPRQLPLTEDHDFDPMYAYATRKRM